jgi:DNA polymerase-3 subunit epsilon
MAMKYIKEASADSVVLLDFETSGLSPDNGDRAIEIGAVRIEQGEITDRFQMLMNPGFRVNSPVPCWSQEDFIRMRPIWLDFPKI